MSKVTKSTKKSKEGEEKTKTDIFFKRYLAGMDENTFKIAPTQRKVTGYYTSTSNWEKILDKNEVNQWTLKFDSTSKSDHSEGVFTIVDKDGKVPRITPPPVVCVQANMDKIGSVYKEKLGEAAAYFGKFTKGVPDALKEVNKGKDIEGDQDRFAKAINYAVTKIFLLMYQAGVQKDFIDKSVKEIAGSIARTATTFNKKINTSILTQSLLKGEYSEKCNIPEAEFETLYNNYQEECIASYITGTNASNACIFETDESSKVANFAITVTAPVYMKINNDWNQENKEEKRKVPQQKKTALLPAKPKTEKKSLKDEPLFNKKGSELTNQERMDLHNLLLESGEYKYNQLHYTFGNTIKNPALDSKEERRMKLGTVASFTFRPKVFSVREKSNEGKATFGKYGVKFILTSPDISIFANGVDVQTGGNEKLDIIETDETFTSEELKRLIVVGEKDDDMKNDEDLQPKKKLKKNEPTQKPSKKPVPMPITSHQPEPMEYEYSEEQNNEQGEEGGDQGENVDQDPLDDAQGN